jgi:hypothetical protein
MSRAAGAEPPAERGERHRACREAAPAETGNRPEAPARLTHRYTKRRRRRECGRGRDRRRCRSVPGPRVPRAGGDRQPLRSAGSTHAPVHQAQAATRVRPRTRPAALPQRSGTACTARRRRPATAPKRRADSRIGTPSARGGASVAADATVRAAAALRDRVYREAAAAGRPPQSLGATCPSRGLPGRSRSCRRGRSTSRARRAWMCRELRRTSSSRGSSWSPCAAS